MIALLARRHDIDNAPSQPCPRRSTSLLTKTSSRLTWMLDLWRINPHDPDRTFVPRHPNPHRVAIENIEDKAGACRDRPVRLHRFDRRIDLPRNRNHKNQQSNND